MIPVEIITLLGSALVSGVMSIWSMSLKSKQEANKMMISSMKQEGAMYQAARENPSADASWTQRFIAVVGLLSVIVWPKVVPVIAPWVDVWVGWTQWNPGWLFVDGKEVFNWKQMNGLILTPLDTHLVSSIVGFYLGGSVTKR